MCNKNFIFHSILIRKPNNENKRLPRIRKFSFSAEKKITLWEQIYLGYYIFIINIIRAIFMVIELSM